MASPLMEPTPSDPDSSSLLEDDTSDKKKKYIRFALIALVVLLVIYIMYYSYSCFCSNQALGSPEKFTEKTVKSGVDSDKSFDIDAEVQRLSDLQEQYLRKLNRR